MRNAVKFRVYPTTEQEHELRQAFGNARFVYNHSLAEREQIYKLTGKTALSSSQSTFLPCLKKAHPFLNLSPAVTLQQALRDLDDAYNRFFKGQNGRPRFKRKRDKQSIRFPNGHKRTDIRREDNRIRIPKIGTMRCAFSKEIHGEITSATVSMTPDGKFYIALALEQDAPAPLPKTGKEVGCDLGVKTRAVLSDGTEYANHKYLKKSERKLARAQRSLSRKKKGSKNCEKARKKVAKIHRKIANQRLDSTHKMTHEMVEKYDFIAIEDLNIKGMLKNHTLAKAISDADWGEIVRQLTYKCERAGKTLVKIGRFYASSQICSVCGYKNPAVKDLSVREWDCPHCNTHHDRDVNAAVNILNEGKRQRGIV